MFIAAPPFRVGPAAWVDVGKAYMQLGQAVFSHFQYLELNGCRVVVLGPVEPAFSLQTSPCQAAAVTDGWSSAQ